MSAASFDLSMVTVEEPAHHGKRFTLRPDGTLARETSAWHRHGRLRRVRTDLDGLLELMRQAVAGQHLVCGVPPGLEVGTEATLAAVEAAQPGDLTRTDAVLPFPAGPGLMVIDCDLHGDVERLQAQLHDACPELAEVRTLATTSSSANIARADAGAVLREATGVKGRRIFPRCGRSNFPTRLRRVVVV